MSSRHSILYFVLLLLSSFTGIVTAQPLPDVCAGGGIRYGVQGLPNSTFVWTVTGGSIIANYNDSIDVRWNYERGSHAISVIEESDLGCFGEPVEAEVIIKAPVANIGDNVEACVDDFFIFDATTTYQTDVTYLWPDSSTSATFATGTEGTVWVRITGTDGCADYDSAYLTLNPLPVVDLGKDTALCGTATLLLDPGFYMSYEWSTGAITNSISVDGQRKEPETFWVEVTDENGCRGSDTILLEVCDVYLLFDNMPNTITPGDKNDQNDRWEIPHIELFPDAILEIYDRWGRLVYRTDDIFNNPWKGETMSGKELPMDAYYFVIDLKVSNVKPMTGYVNVVR